jgi:multiple sugar transport system substrate-binding protein
VIGAFQAEYPHITVQITDIPENEYVTKIDTALLAGEPPDLGYIYERRWIVGGYFMPLDDMVNEQAINIDDYNVGAMSQACLVEGSVYCIGTYTGAVLMFYNKDMFDAAGIPYPSATEPMTIDEYADMALQLTIQSDNIEERIWGGDAGATIWWMDARNFFSEDGRTAIDYINDEATAHTHQVIADMRAQGSVISATDASLVAGVDLLSTGQLATSIIDNAVAVPQLEEVGINWGAAVPPVEQAGDLPWIPLWSDGLGVFTQSDSPEEAALFATFLGTVGNELRLEVIGDLPLNMSLAEEAGWAAESAGRQEVLEAVQVARPPLFIPDYWGVLDPMNEAFSGLMLEDGMSAQDAFNEIAPIVQDNLDEAWETWDSIQ